MGFIKSVLNNAVRKTIKPLDGDGRIYHMLIESSERLILADLITFCLTLKLPGPAAGVGGSLTVTVA